MKIIENFYPLNYLVRKHSHVLFALGAFRFSDKTGSIKLRIWGHRMLVFYKIRRMNVQKWYMNDDIFSNTQWLKWKISRKLHENLIRANAKATIKKISCTKHRKFFQTYLNSFISIYCSFSIIFSFPLIFLEKVTKLCRLLD